jgi:hypothetical protein
MCKIAHPDFNQLYNILRTKSTNYSPEMLLEITLEDKLFSSLDHGHIMNIRDELIQIIDKAINELGNEVTTRYRDTDEVEFDINNGILLPSLTKKRY